MNRQRRKELADKVRYGHLRFNEGGAVTIASLIDRENNFLYYGCAYCNPVDQFIKKMGSWIAKDNLFWYLREYDLSIVLVDKSYNEKAGQFDLSLLDNLRTKTIFSLIEEKYSVYFPNWLQEILYYEKESYIEKEEEYDGYRI